MLSRLVALALLLIFIPPAYSAACQESLDQLREANLSASSRYPEISIVRDDTLLILYSTERGNCPPGVVNFTSAVTTFLKKFQSAYHSAGQGEGLEAVHQALDLEAEITSLEEHSPGALGKEVLLAARESRGSLLETLASEYEERAQGEESTRDKLRYYRIAILGYRGSDNRVEATSLEIRRDIIEENYRRDMERAETYESLALSSLEKASSGESVVGSYIASREARINFEKALQIYRAHGEEEKVSLAREKLAQCERIMEGARGKIVPYYLGLTLALTSLSVYILRRILQWKSDSHEYFLGNELLEGGRHEE